MIAAWTGLVVSKPLDPGECNAEQEIEGEILGYLAQHPSAKDTLDGIAAWWLQEHRIEPTLTQVKRVLDRLVASKAIREVHRLDGNTFYSLARDDSKES